MEIRELIELPEAVLKERKNLFLVIINYYK